MALFKRKKNNRALTAEQEKATVLARESAKKTRPGREKKKSVVKEDRHYAAFAKILRHTEWICICLAIIVGVAMSFIFSDEITTENIALLFSGMSFRFPGEETTFDAVRYDADKEMDFAAFREYFAVATTSGLRLYDHRGNIAAEQNVSMKDPVLSSGKEYILQYDREGSGYIIANAMATVYTGGDGHTLYFAGINDDGSHYTCSSSSDHPAIVRVYNRNFKMTRELKFDRYPLYGTMSREGNKMLFLSYKAGKDGLICGYVNIYDMTAQTVVLLEKSYTKLPLHGIVFEDGRAAVVFEDGICFYDADGKERGQLTYENSGPVKLAMTGELIAVSFDKSKVHGENLIELYDPTAQTRIETIEYTGRIERLSVLAGRLFVFEEETTSVYDVEQKKMISLTLPIPEKTVIGKENTLFFCYGNKAENKGEEIDKQFKD